MGILDLFRRDTKHDPTDQKKLDRIFKRIDKLEKKQRSQQDFLNNALSRAAKRGFEKAESKALVRRTNPSNSGLHPLVKQYSGRPAITQAAQSALQAATNLPVNSSFEMTAVDHQRTADFERRIEVTVRASSLATSKPWVVDHDSANHTSPMVRALLGKKGFINHE